MGFESAFFLKNSEADSRSGSFIHQAVNTFVFGHFRLKAFLIVDIHEELQFSYPIAKIGPMLLNFKIYHLELLKRSRPAH